MSTAFSSFGARSSARIRFHGAEAVFPRPAVPAWKGVQDAAAGGAGEIERVYLNAARLGREALPLDNLERELHQRDPRGAEAVVLEALMVMAQRIELRMPDIVEDILGAGGNAAGTAMPQESGTRIPPSPRMTEDERAEVFVADADALEILELNDRTDLIILRASATPAGYYADVDSGTCTPQRWSQNDEKAWKANPLKLNMDEWEGVRAYQQDLNEIPVNKILRKGSKSGPEAGRVIKGLDSAFKRTPGLKKPTTVYRGLSYSALQQLTKGKSFVDRGYASTSVMRSVAKKFADRGTGAIMVITLPKGTRALDVNRVLGRSSFYRNEQEFLLPRGTRLELVRSETVGDTMVAYFQVLPASLRASAASCPIGFAPAFGPMSFDLINPEAVKWARTQSATMVKYIGKSTQESIRILIARSFSEGIPVDQVARMLRDSIGLDPRRTQALVNLRNKIAAKPGGKVWAGSTAIRVPDPVTSAFINARTEAYAKRLLAQRATAIARTESMAAANEGQRQLWLQARDKNLLFGNELRVWIITGDKRLCPQCEGSAGDLAPLDKPFPNGAMNPPLHPMCRCAQGISGKRGKKAVPKVDQILGPQSALDKLLAPSLGDSTFARIPGGDITNDARLAQQVADGFAKRLRAAKKLGANVDLAGSHIGAGWLSNSAAWASSPLGRQQIATIDTALEQIGPAMNRMRSMGAIGPKEKIVLRFHTGAGNEYAHASVHTMRQGHMSVNFNQPAWSSRRALERSLASDYGAMLPFHPVADLDSIFVHEMGHIMHYRGARVAKTHSADFGFGQRRIFKDVRLSWADREWEKALKKLGTDWDVPGSLGQRVTEAQRIGRTVSGYAEKNTAEFVAETWTGLMYGKQYPAEVMRLYRVLGGAEVRGGAAKAVEVVGKNVVKQIAENRWEVTLSNGRKAEIFYDSRIQRWRSADWLSEGATQADLIALLEKQALRREIVAVPLPKPIELPKPKPDPLPKPEGREKVMKPIREIPAGEVGDEIRRIQALRAQDLDYTEIARRMGYDVTRRGKGWGKGPQKVFETIKKFGDPLGRVAPLPRSALSAPAPSGPAPSSKAWVIDSPGGSAIKQEFQPKSGWIDDKKAAVQEAKKAVKDAHKQLIENGFVKGEKVDTSVGSEKLGRSEAYSGGTKSSRTTYTRPDGATAEIIERYPKYGNPTVAVHTRTPHKVSP